MTSLPIDGASLPPSGVRVLELARILAGPWAGQLLSDLGADVIKVERPGEGDDTRQWGPPFVRAVTGDGLSAAYFHSCNRGKRSVAIDIATPEGQAEVRALALQADVIIENFKVGGLARYRQVRAEAERGYRHRLAATFNAAQVSDNAMRCQAQDHHRRKSVNPRQQT